MKNRLNKEEGREKTERGRRVRIGPSEEERRKEGERMRNRGRGGKGVREREKTEKHRRGMGRGRGGAGPPAQPQLGLRGWFPSRRVAWPPAQGRRPLSAPAPSLLFSFLLLLPSLHCPHPVPADTRPSLCPLGVDDWPGGRDCPGMDHLFHFSGVEVCSVVMGEGVRQRPRETERQGREMEDET